MTDTGAATEEAPLRARAVVVDADDTFHRVRRRERLRGTFWYIPTFCIGASAVLGVVVRVVDEARAVTPEDAPAWLASASAAQSMLSTIAAAMLTFVGVVFSISLVALQLASSQLSPRVLRSFVRSPVTKLAFGTFMATFFFSLFLLPQVPQGVDAEIPVVGATTALLLVVASVIMFVIYVDATVRQMQVSEVIGRVAVETRVAVALNYFDADRFIVTTIPDLRGDRTVVFVDHRGTARRRRQRGVLLGVDVVGAVRWAQEHDAMVRLIARIGEYTPAGTPLFEVWGGDGADPGELDELVDLGRERTLYQDPLYGIRQLVDTAVQALSPAVNAPTTAVQVVDRIVDILISIGSKPSPAHYVVDGAGAVRYECPIIDWEQVVALAFVEIRQYGVGSTQVCRRLMAAFETIDDSIPPDRRPAIDAQRAALRAAVERRFTEPDEQRLALEPDRMGLA